MSKKQKQDLSDLLGKCQTQLLQSRIELSGLSALFKNMDDCEFSADELHGIGISLDRIAYQVEASLADLSSATPASEI